MAAAWLRCNLRISVAVVGILGPARGLIADEAERRVEAPQPAAQISIPGGSDVVVVPVTLGARNYQFLLDTGSSCSAVDESLIPLLGPRREAARAETAATDIAIDFFDVPRGMRVANLSFEDRSVLGTIDLEAVRRATGYSIYGILGMDFLERFAIQLDPDENKLRIYSGQSSFLGKAIAMRYEAHVPFVTAVFPGQLEQQLLLDTGYYSSGSVALSPERFELLRRRTGGKAVRLRNHQASAAGDASGARMMAVPYLSVGDARVFDIVVDDSRLDLLGLSFLARFKATFDFPNKKLYLAPGHCFREPDRPDRSGLHLWRVDGNVAVRSVDDRSPAAAASIEPGDIVLEINGSSVSEVSLHQLRILLRSEVERVRLVTRHDGDRNSVTLTLMSRGKGGRGKGEKSN